MLLRTGILAIILALVVGFGGESQPLSVETTDLSLSSWWDNTVSPFLESAARELTTLVEQEAKSLVTDVDCVAVFDPDGLKKWADECEEAWTGLLATASCVSNMVSCINKMVMGIYNQCKSATNVYGCITGAAVWAATNIGIGLATGGATAEALTADSALGATFEGGDNLGDLMDTIQNNDKFTDVYDGSLSSSMSSGYHDMLSYEIQYEEQGLSSSEIQQNWANIAENWYDNKGIATFPWEEDSEEDYQNFFNQMKGDLAGLGGDGLTEEEAQMAKLLTFFQDLSHNANE